MKTIRTFVAVKIPVNNYIQRFRNALRQLSEKENIKLIDEEALHLTLFFIGNASQELVRNTIENLILIANNNRAFDLYIEGIGSFSIRNRKQIIWMGVRENLQLTKLQSMICSEFETLGLKPSTIKFSPHISIGRALISKNLNNELDHIMKQKFVLGKVSVSSFELFKSDLHPTGPKYTSLYLFKLKQ